MNVDRDTRARAVYEVLNQARTAGWRANSVETRFTRMLSRGDRARLRTIIVIEMVDDWLGHPFMPLCDLVSFSPWWGSEADGGKVDVWERVWDSFRWCSRRWWAGV